jgi:cell division topological specificity factor
MFESIINLFKKMGKQEKEQVKSKDAAKERLHLVLIQDRANVSADFLDLMKQEIIEVIKKYIDVDENAIDVRLTNKENGDGTTGAPSLYANIPIISIKEEVRSGMARQNNNANKKEEEPKKKQNNETKKSGKKLNKAKDDEQVISKETTEKDAESIESVEKEPNKEKETNSEKNETEQEVKPEKVEEVTNQ